MNPTAYTLRGGRIIDPVSGTDRCGDLHVANGRIVDPGDFPGGPEIDAGGLVVAPGFIDLHVHLREPGQTHKEDIATGTLAAAAGGFTTVVAMPNTTPAIDTAERFLEQAGRIRDKAVVRVIQAAALTRERAGLELTDFRRLRDAGATVLSDDGTCIQSAKLMLEAMLLARECGLVIIDHCEDEGVCAGGVMHFGAVARELGVPGQRRATEELIVARNIVLSREAGSPVHIQHISADGSVDWVRYARHAGIRITAEAAPHHICLTHEEVRRHGANAKMNPPLREERDRRAVLRGLADGTICAIATDHAPHAESEKARGLAGAPAGIVGLEAAVPLCLTELVYGGILDLPGFVAKFTSGPRSVLGLQAGTLEAGMPADITLLDPDAHTVLRSADLHSRSANSPYDGRECRGAVVAAIVGGQPAFSRLPDLRSPAA